MQTLGFVKSEKNPQLTFRTRRQQEKNIFKKLHKGFKKK